MDLASKKKRELRDVGRPVAGPEIVVDCRANALRGTSAAGGNPSTLDWN